MKSWDKEDSLGNTMSTINNDLERSLHLLLRDLLGLQAGERLLICGDRGSDQQVIEATAAVGGKLGAPTVVKIRHSLSKSLTEEPEIDITLAMQNTDAIVDFSERYLYYTPAWRKALRAGARGYCLSNLSSDAIIRCIGKVDITEMMRLGKRLAEQTRNANEIKVTSESGTDITLRMKVFEWKLSSLLPRRFRGSRSWVGNPAGICLKPGQAISLSGQVSFNGSKRGINGTLVFDGSIYPPFEVGLVSTPVLCKVKQGRIIEIAGGQEAKIFKEYLESFNHASTFEIVHFSYGFNLGARLSGRISEDERLYGCITTGIGRGRSHADGVIKTPSVQIDGEFIEKDGVYQFSY